MYIAAQGLFIYFFQNKIRNLVAPTDVTLHDFIRMIWQLRIQSIIMLTRLFEDGKVKKQNVQIIYFFLSSINVYNIGQMKVKNR
jgi:protein tyrosine phosphatase